MAPFVPISKDKAEDRSAIHCTADRHRCAQLRKVDETWTLSVFDRLPGATTVPIARYAMPWDGDVSATIWPHAVFVGGSAREIYGVAITRRQGYSGGGSSATVLSLGIFDAKRPDMVEIGRVPGDYSAMIRACFFGTRDSRQRAGACHDEYDFRATLALDPTVQRGIPRFVYTTRAKTFPGKVSRSQDSLAAPPLRKKDLVWAADAKCSYRRILAFDPKNGKYAFDVPPPACEDYEDQ